MRERNRERERNRVRERETRKKRELRVALGSLSLEAKKFLFGPQLECFALVESTKRGRKRKASSLSLSLSLFSSSDGEPPPPPRRGHGGRAQGDGRGAARGEGRGVGEEKRERAKMTKQSHRSCDRTVSSMPCPSLFFLYRAQACSFFCLAQPSKETRSLKRCGSIEGERRRSKRGRV